MNHLEATRKQNIIIIIAIIIIKCNNTSYFLWAILPTTTIWSKKYIFLLKGIIRWAHGNQTNQAVGWDFLYFIFLRVGWMFLIHGAFPPAKLKYFTFFFFRNKLKYCTRLLGYMFFFNFFKLMETRSCQVDLIDHYPKRVKLGLPIVKSLYKYIDIMK